MKKTHTHTTHKHNKWVISSGHHHITADFMIQGGGMLYHSEHRVCLFMQVMKCYWAGKLNLSKSFFCVFAILNWKATVHWYFSWTKKKIRNCHNLVPVLFLAIYPVRLIQIYFTQRGNTRKRANIIYRNHILFS